MSLPAYPVLALFATKLGQAWRLSPGGDFSAKLLHIMEGLTAAFRNLVPSFHPFDLCIGVIAAGIIRLAVYVKGKNAKKYSMATIRLMPLHIGKGRSVGTAISDIIDYVENPDKTDKGQLVTSYGCNSRIADKEFLADISERHITGLAKMAKRYTLALLANSE